MSVDRAQGKGNFLLGNRDCQSPIGGRVDEQAKKTRHTFLENMDAIERGVEVWFEENTGYSRRVAETTVEIARALGMSESDIKRWVSSRLMRDTEKGRVIKSHLERLQGSSLADGVDNNRHF